jgi:hypothetical protein
MPRGRRKSKPPDEKKKPQATFEALSRLDEQGNVRHVYKVMEWLIEQYHSDLEEANIVIANHMGNIREDADGTVGFGRVKRGNDLDRCFADYDLVLIIPYDMFQHSDNEKRHAIVDNLLCQCAVKKDQHHEVVVNSAGKIVYRIRKPIRVFAENIGRYGLWQSDAVKESVARYNDSKRPLLPESRKKAKKSSESALDPGESVPDSHLRNGSVNGHANGNGKPSRSRTKLPEPESGSLESLGLPQTILDACHGCDLKSIEDVVRMHGESGALGLAEIKGMGSEKAETLWTAIELYLEHHPELAEAK